MCLIAFAYKTHSEYPLILIANRDEFYNRPTRPAQFWIEEGYPNILAGKDLKAGGTWIGINKNGRWAALTNYRDLTRLKENLPSRGHLALDFLQSDNSAKDYLNFIKTSAASFNDFNLLLSDNNDLLHYTNVSNQITKISEGVHGLSNALLDTPWPKLTTITDELKTAIDNNNLEKDNLFDLLFNGKKAATELLPQTGLSLELEKAMSSIFIHTPFYGTRCSTIITINKAGAIEFTERRFSDNKTFLSDATFKI